MSRNDNELIEAALDLVRSVDYYEEVIVNSVRFTDGVIEGCFSSLLEYRDKLWEVIAVREARGDDLAAHNADAEYRASLEENS